jgi:hypothetical protein
MLHITSVVTGWAQQKMLSPLRRTCALVTLATLTVAITAGEAKPSKKRTGAWRTPASCGLRVACAMSACAMAARPRPWEGILRCNSACGLPDGMR